MAPSNWVVKNVYENKAYITLTVVLPVLAKKTPTVIYNSLPTIIEGWILVHRSFVC